MTACHQWRASDPLELELEAVAGHMMWALGTKLGSSGREGGALKCQPLSGPSVPCLEGLATPLQHTLV